MSKFVWEAGDEVKITAPNKANNPAPVDRLYSYIVRFDSGFAPNPFWGTLTLACCKPKVRKSVGTYLSEHPEANVWVMGLSSRHGDKGNDIIHIMKVSEALSFDEYYRKYPDKRPDFEKAKKTGMRTFKQGDNIYKPSRDGIITQLRSCHSIDPNDDKNWTTNPETLTRDLSGQYVLISDHFAYFGSEPLGLPLELRVCVVGIGYKCRFDEDVLSAFSDFVADLRKVLEAKSVMAPPKMWPEGDTSWKQ